MREPKLAAGAAIPRRMEFAEKSRQRGNNRQRERWRRSRHAAGRPSARRPRSSVRRPPDEIDEAAWLMIPLLRAAEARWAATVSPARAETPPPDPWPFLSVYGLGNTNENFLPPPP